ncbi:MAG: hypothetical protein HWN69_00980 [Desulfobacterales bacterium]|nr:hypothetical protein [Desulfobacterales bacterium]
MKLSGDFEKNFRIYLMSALSWIGPQESLDHKAGDLYSFRGGLKYTNDYFNGGLGLRLFVLGNEKKLNENINVDTAHSIFTAITEKAYEEIKQKNPEITKALNEYLDDDMITVLIDEFKRIVNELQGNYKISLLTNLIELTDVDILTIGNVHFSKSTFFFSEDFPDTIRPQPAITLLGTTEQSREEVISKNLDHVALTTEASGYHHKDEKSLVFYKALAEFKQVFAFLVFCRHFLSNVKNKEFEIKTKAVQPSGAFKGNKSGIQRYYLWGEKDKGCAVEFSTLWSTIDLAREAFIIDTETLEALKKSCYLEQYNSLLQGIDKNRIRGKIRRCLDWFLKSHLEDDSTDEVVSLFIGLETLLATGPDPFRGAADDLAENVALLMTPHPDERYSCKKDFKKAYRLRCKIIHSGEVIDWDKDWVTVRSIRNYVVWSLRGILSHLDEISRYGKEEGSMQEYFDRLKLGGM